ncbi:hypothetical protein [Candidatus Poriferisocius sp.]|uniref:hypothetical protein n=1 Tax=Candidatus Poriferisocius sp. TaxID=3101276 RepID=UPI003B027CCA
MKALMATRHELSQLSAIAKKLRTLKPQQNKPRATTIVLISIIPAGIVGILAGILGEILEYPMFYVVFYPIVVVIVIVASIWARAWKQRHLVEEPAPRSPEI